ncbi:MAG: hypothetical protein IKK94_03270, partial [Clostridia bacterium]|nr:hypothetical protein [Clostridia bacterium]
MAQKRTTGKRKISISFSVRLIIIAVLFSLVTIFYIGKLANIQLVNRSLYTSSAQKTYSRTVTIRAQRGEIFDRNGKALVTNVHTYNLDFDYGSLSKNASESNKVILGVIDALGETGNAEKRTPTKSPLIGFYPDYVYNPDLMSDPSYKAKYDRAIKEMG